MAYSYLGLRTISGSLILHMVVISLSVIMFTISFILCILVVLGYGKSIQDKIECDCNSMWWIVGGLVMIIVLFVCGLYSYLVHIFKSQDEKERLLSNVYYEEREEHEASWLEEVGRRYSQVPILALFLF